ncbi:HAD-IA family hydrolase [Candidatus Woesearchaeota archaeon]|nr:HAD-IA family hydrolase [Candidatus Woesearchaeota archaeon]
MIKAVIFDLDNTLVDFFKMKHMSVEAAASAMVDAGLDRKTGSIMKKLFEHYDEHGWEDQRIFQKYLKKEIGRIDYKILAYAINAYRRVRVSFLEAYPHVLSTLISLKIKGIKLALVTDAPKLQAWIRLNAMKLDTLFDVIIAYEDTRRLKPSKEPFTLALKNLGLRPDECLMVGDMPERDMRGAKKLGIKTCFAKYGGRKRGNISVDYEIADINELLEITGK